MKRMALVGALVLFIGATVLAQRGGYLPAVDAANPRYDGRYMFMRLKYTVGPGGYYYQNGLPSWSHGLPKAEENMMKIMDAVSLLNPHVDESVVMGLDNPEMFKFPVAFMVEPGFLVMSDAEVAALRAYLQKGGFLIVDDFRTDGRGSTWDNFQYNMTRVFPGAEFLPMEITHPIFHSFFEINSFDVIPQAYDGGGGRGGGRFGRGGRGASPVPPEFYGLFEDNDPSKRLMAIVNYNTDVSDFWEFSARGMYIVDDQNEAYKLGANYIIYGLTH